MIRPPAPTSIPLDQTVAWRQQTEAAARSLAGGHRVQRQANPHAVAPAALVQINRHLAEGFRQYEGGHRVQQMTYEPQVPAGELQAINEGIARRSQVLAQGSKVQQEIQAPRLADQMADEAHALAQELRARPAEARAVQATGLQAGQVGRVA
jgi:hypothetical protein